MAHALAPQDSLFVLANASTPPKAKQTVELVGMPVVAVFYVNKDTASAPTEQPYVTANAPPQTMIPAIVEPAEMPAPQEPPAKVANALVLRDFCSVVALVSIRKPTTATVEPAERLAPLGSYATKGLVAALLDFQTATATVWT